MRKGLNIDPTCLMCQCFTENEDHLFLDCQLTKRASFVTTLRFHIPSNTNIHAWLLNWFNCGDQAGVQLVGEILWKVCVTRDMKPQSSCEPIGVPTKRVQAAGDCERCGQFGA